MTFVEVDDRIAAERAGITDRADRWATFQVGHRGRAVSEVAADLGCDCHTMMNAVNHHGRPLIEDPNRIGNTTAVGLDEVLFRRDGPFKHRLWSTQVVDVAAANSSTLCLVATLRAAARDSPSSLPIGRRGSGGRRWICRNRPRRLRRMDQAPPTLDFRVVVGEDSEAVVDHGVVNGVGHAGRERLDAARMKPMGFRDIVHRWFGASEEVDPDEPVEIGVVPILNGPIAVEKLREAGFDAVGVEAYNIVTSTTSGFRIVVPQHQSEAGVAKLDEILRS